MRCPSCHADNPDRAKFCLECGAKLAPAVQACPQCGAELPVGAKFCLECGARIGAAPSLPPVPSPEQHAAERLKRLMPKEYAERLLASRGSLAGERRTVTILFCDVKGSTAMAQNLDPEDVLEIMNGAFEVLIPPIYRHEGTLARLMGDAILAFFGAPIAHEDDAERACRAGLEILEGARSYAAELLKNRSLAGFNVRIGINTGLVVVGEVGNDLRVEYTAMGDAINLAARMEQNAEPGTLLVAAETYNRVRHAFETLVLDPILVKGHGEAVPVYRVLSAWRRNFHNTARGVQGIQTRMVGRDAELKTLIDAACAAAEDGERLAVTILGDPGLGKSRLLQEFENTLQTWPETPQIWRGRSRAEIQSNPFALLRDLIQGGFGLEDGEPNEVSQRKLEQGFRKYLVLDDNNQRAHWVGTFLGLIPPGSPHLGANPNPQEIYDRARGYLLELLQSGSRLPVILCEDIHWADDSSLDLLADLAAPGAGRKPALFVFLARPTLLERRPHWGEGLPGAHQIRLRPLAKRDSRRLVDDIFQKIDQIPPELREQIVATAEGSPLFLEELIKALIQEDVITCTPEAWQIHPDRLQQLRLPPSLSSILQARIDHLPAGESQALQQAAIFGRLFWDQAVAHLSGASLAEIAPMLEALHRRELVYQHETTQVRGASEYIFNHSALRDVAYEGTLKKLRRQYHAQAAAWLESLNEPEALAGMIAGHYEQAGRAGEAVEWFRQAGEMAARRYANQEAAQYFGRALALLDGLPEADRNLRWSLLFAREGVLHISSQRDAQAADLDALERLAAGDAARLAEVALRRTYFCEEGGDYAACQAAAEQAIASAGQAGALELQLRAFIRLGLALEQQGRLEDAEQTLLKARAQAEERQDLVNLDLCLHNLALAHYYQGCFEEAAALFEESLQISRALNDRRSEGISLRGLTAVYHDLHRLDQAAQYGRQAVDIYHLIGDRSGECQALNNLAIIAQTLGYFDEARCSFQQALALAEEIRSRFAECLTVNNLALLLLDLEDQPQAVPFARRAVEIARQLEDRIGLGYALSALGRALEAGKEYGAARAAHNEALELRRATEQPALAIDNLGGLARCALAQGLLDEAASLAGEILAWIGSNTIEGVEDPIRLYWTVMQVSAARSDSAQAEEARRIACQMLNTWAAAISSPEARQSFLTSVPLHREIIC